jgi:hypothetical protein
MPAMRYFTSLCLLVLLCSGCSQNLLTKQDYQHSQAEFMRNNVHEALVEFPRGKEDGDFITTMEKTYLSLIQGVPDIEALKRKDAALQNRVRYHVSREVRTFFYAQTAEDYYAAEHEVIWMHLLLSWGYSQQGKYEDACVEAREAGNLLTMPWSPAGHFDDANMRVFLGVMWTMCGEWREAQVDFRAAYEMDNSLAWANELAQRDKPPAQFFLVLGGPGPEPEWDPDMSHNPLRSARRVNFRLRGQKSKLTMVDKQGREIEPHLTPDASAWYARQMERESELHDLILDSTYGAQATGSAAWAGAKIAAAGTEGVVVGVAGTVLGVGLCYYGSQASLSSGELKGVFYSCAAGAVVVAGSLDLGEKIAKDGYAKSDREFRREMDPSPTYRFVRYLPEYLWLGWSDQPVTYPVRLTTAYDRVEVHSPGIGKGVAVNAVYVPDVGASSSAPVDTTVQSTAIGWDRQFAGIETARSATVVLLPMYATYNNALNDEKSIRKFGCTYTTRYPALVASLVNDLEAKVITVSRTAGSWMQEPRELIYLTLESGEEVQFRFSPVFSDQKVVRGEFVRAQREIAVGAELSLPRALYGWALKADGRPSQADSKNKGCQFVEHYQDYRDYMR